MDPVVRALDALAGTLAKEAFLDRVWLVLVPEIFRLPALRTIQSFDLLFDAILVLAFWTNDVSLLLVATVRASLQRIHTLESADWILLLFGVDEDEEVEEEEEEHSRREI